MPQRRQTLPQQQYIEEARSGVESCNDQAGQEIGPVEASAGQVGGRKLACVQRAWQASEPLLAVSRLAPQDCCPPHAHLVCNSAPSSHSGPANLASSPPPAATAAAAADGSIPFAPALPGLILLHGCDSRPPASGPTMLPTPQDSDIHDMARPWPSGAQLSPMMHFLVVVAGCQSRAGSRMGATCRVPAHTSQESVRMHPSPTNARRDLHNLQWLQQRLTRPL